VLEPLGTPIAGVVGCEQGSVPSRVDEWYKHGERGGATIHPSSGVDGTGRTVSAVPQSAVVVLAGKYQGRLDWARNSAAKITRGDTMETD
jgi:hypothetical protein